MFEFDAGKLIVLGIVALIVIGPKELPRVMLQLGQALGRMRRMAAEFRLQFMDAMREAEIEAIKSDAAKLAESAMAGAGSDVLAQIRAELTSALEASDKRMAAHESPVDAEPSVRVASPPAGSMAGEPSAGAPAPQAEMQALAEALGAEIGEAAPRHANLDGAALQGKV